MSSTSKLVYLAGPYSHPDPVENTHRTVQFATEMMDDGVVIPFIPHLSMLWHTITPKPLEFWYAYDLHLLRRCDAVFRLRGESTGADAEVAEAHRLNLPVFTDRNRLYAWALAQLADVAPRTRKPAHPECGGGPAGRGWAGGTTV